jgi:hypothetical protein
MAVVIAPGHNRSIRLLLLLAVEASMITNGNEPGSALDKTTDAVLDVTEAVQTTTNSIAAAIEDSRRPGGMLNQLARLTREAPLGALAVAFLVGVMFARRR